MFFLLNAHHCDYLKLLEKGQGKNNEILQITLESLQMPVLGDFPGSPVVSTRCFPCWCPALFPDQGTKIPQIVRHDQRGKKASDRVQG